MKNINTNIGCHGCGCCKNADKDNLMASMMSEMLAAAAVAALLADDMPDASPMDLLSKNDYEQMDKYLNENYGPLRMYIDDNYVALLMALSEYEDIDMGEKIKAHLIHNLTQN